MGTQRSTPEVNRKGRARCWFGWAALAAGLLPLLAAAEPPPRGKVLDRAIALVEGRVITLSELEFEARVALIQAGGREAATAQLDEAALRAALEQSIGQRLETSEAEKLQAYPVEEAEVEAALRAFEARFADEPGGFERFLAQCEADRQELATVLYRQLRAAKLLDSKLRLRAQVTEADLRRYYELHLARGGPPFEEIKAALRQKLVAERMAALTAAELAHIRRGADVRVIAPFARATPDLPDGGGR